MRIEDAQTIVVMKFEQGMSPTEIDKELGMRKGFAYEAILVWWELMDERDKRNNDDEEQL